MAKTPERRGVAAALWTDSEDGLSVAALAVAGFLRDQGSVLHPDYETIVCGSFHAA